MNKKNVFNLLLMFIVLYLAYFCYFNLNGKILLISEISCGFILGILTMNIWINSKDRKINAYKRALEKESVVSSENGSKIKTLESKIEVLEAALKNALKKND